MPISPPKPCRQAGCNILVHDGVGFCAAHKRAIQRQIDSRRVSSSRRGYGHKWREARIHFLRAHPLCECTECQAGRLRTTPATVVDHIVAHKGDMKLFWDRNNWQAMSKPCHDKKTALEDGRWSARQSTTGGG
jgi:5-methylcytosine-specific restriction enzyme A